MDLADAVAKRPVLTKPQYIARVRRVANSRAAQKVGAKCASRFRQTCRDVIAKKGAATKG